MRSALGGALGLDEAQAGHCRAVIGELFAGVGRREHGTATVLWEGAHPQNARERAVAVGHATRASAPRGLASLNNQAIRMKTLRKN